VAIVVDVDGIAHRIVEVEIIRPVAGILAWIVVGDERDFPLLCQPRQIRGVITDESVNVGVVHGRVERDERRLTVARGLCWNGPREGQARQNRNEQSGCPFHFRSPPYFRASPRPGRVRAAMRLAFQSRSYADRRADGLPSSRQSSAASRFARTPTWVRLP